MSKWDWNLGKALVGKTIKAATKDADGNLYVATDDGSFKLEPEGDCCAHCYVQHISGTDALAAGAKVVSIEDIEGSSDESSEYEVSDTWGHRITTSKGVCSIEMRVDHNGYYGGSLTVDVFHGDALPGAALDDF